MILKVTPWLGEGANNNKVFTSIVRITGSRVYVLINGDMLPMLPPPASQHFVDSTILKVTNWSNFLQMCLDFILKVADRYQI